VKELNGDHTPTSDFSHSATPYPLPPTPTDQKPKLLIVEDDEDIRTQMKWALTGDYEVFTAGERGEALEILEREGPQAATLDLGLPPHPADTTEGFATLTELRVRDPLLKVIVITGQGEKENALKAVAEGACDFFLKPIQTSELKIVLQRAFYISRLERELAVLRRTCEEEPFREMLGSSPRMQQVFATIRKVAGTEAPVLITGESGTGKELAAKAIHGLSGRKDKPFIVINCGAIPENLLESELFGHEKGAFTGAHIQRKGRIELAQGGTLFLDEIAELPTSLQVKLLRFLQEQTIERVGGRESITVDARIVAATNRDLKKEIQEDRFREDLFYRIGVIMIHIPPLRERQGDVLLLAQSFLRKFAEESKKKVAGLSTQAARALEKYSWPGNVRELENRVKRAVIMAEGARISPADLEMASLYKYAGQTLKDAREAMEKELIQATLARNKGNITKAAEELGVSRPTLYELMERVGVQKEGTGGKV
jgi:two-component system, NtrC family, response regulator